MSEWDSWVGNEQKVRNHFDEEQAHRWMATFNRNPFIEGMLTHERGGICPPQGVHFALCQPSIQTEFLGEDGHPKRWDSRESFLPPIHFPRRMWASSKILFHEPIAIGSQLERVSRVASVEERKGRSGQLVFVDVAHEIRADDQLCITETQTLVFREAAHATAPLSPPALGGGRFAMNSWAASMTMVPDTTLLFRYSAVTFNSHRIHYDVPYAQNSERYRGLVVHGPLIASLLLQMAASQRRREHSVREFTFRALSPAIAGEELHLTTDQFGNDLAAFASDGREVMRARAVHRASL